MTQIILHLAVVTVMLFGLLTVSFLPGLVIIWVAALAYGVANGFTWISGGLFAMITVLMLVGSFIDNFLMGASARATGASWVGIAVALVLGLVGSVLWTPLGGLAASLLGLFVVEMIRLRGEWRKALESTKSMAFGCGTSVVVRFGIGLVMILLWGVWVFLSTRAG